MLLYLSIPFGVLSFSAVASLSKDLINNRKVIVLSRLGLLVISTLLFYLTVPTSARFLITKGKYAEAEQIFKTVWKMNKAMPLSGTIERYSIQTQNRGGYLDSFQKKYIISTLDAMNTMDSNN